MQMTSPSFHGDLPGGKATLYINQRRELLDLQARTHRQAARLWPRLPSLYGGSRALAVHIREIALISLLAVVNQ